MVLGGAIEGKLCSAQQRGVGRDTAQQWRGQFLEILRRLWSFSLIKDSNSPELDHFFGEEDKIKPTVLLGTITVE